MSLHDDFGMYYNGTYIGYRQNNGTVLPFLVDSVSNNSDMFSLRNYPAHERQRMEHGEEAHNAMVFNGSIIGTGRNNRNGRSVGMSEDRLVFDLPDPRYVKFDNLYYWVSYRANRSTKKGMCSRRINCQLNFGDTLATLMWDNTPDANIVGGCFLKHGNKLDYKGVPVGELDGVNVVLYSEAAHLSRLLQQEWPECQVTVEPSAEATATPNS